MILHRYQHVNDNVDYSVEITGLEKVDESKIPNYKRCCYSALDLLTGISKHLKITYELNTWITKVKKKAGIV